MASAARDRPEARAASERIAALDLIRGIAVLGILAVNVAGFAGPDSGNYSPDLPRPGSTADHVAFMVQQVLFEGKMRALFSILFGASMVLFIDRAEAARRDGTLLQARRLIWLALFGYLHFLLLWSGDILFIYAMAGFIALLLPRARPTALVVAALLVFSLWQAVNLAQWYPSLSTEAAVRSGTASAEQARSHAETITYYREEDREKTGALTGSWHDRFVYTLSRAYMPLVGAAFIMGETLTYVLLGMALLSSGFFAGEWERRNLRQLAGWGLGLGGLATLGFAGWSALNHWPETAMHFAIGYGLGFAHLAMALGYLALGMLLMPRLLASAAGRRLEAAGRMAFSNYIGTSLVMTALFYGWGMGRYGHYGTAAQAGFVLLGWTLMLAWSAPWLVHFRQGPLEWLWRSLTEWKALPLRRRPIS